MKLYIVEADSHDWDEYDSFVVWAKDSAEALQIAKDEASAGWEERKTNFDNGAKVTKVKKPKQPCILLGSFNAG